MRSTWTRVLVIGALCGIVIPACGDDDDAATSDTEAYCAAIGGLGDRLPTDEEISMILDVAPEEIAEDLDVVLGAIRENGAAAFEDPDVAARFGPIEEFEASNCGSDDDNAAGTSDEIDSDAQRVDVAATEYAFEFSPPEAGAVSFVMTNEGSEIHEMLLARFIGDATIEDAFASEDPEADGLVETVGFEGPVAPGAEGVITLENLEQGRYVMACLIPASDGESHGEKGMVSEFTIG